MPKKAVKIPAARKSDGVRWTLQVSADASGKPARASKERAPKSHAKRTAAKPPERRTRKNPAARKPAAPATVATRRPAAPAPAPTHSASVKAPPAVSLTTGRRMAAIAAGSVLVVAALAVMRDPSRGVSTNVHAQPATRDSFAATTPAQPDAPQVSRPASVSKAAATLPVEKPQPVAAKVRADALPVSPKPSVSPAALAPAPLPATTNTTESVARVVTPEAPPTGLAPRANGTPESLSSAAVTITGCLEGTTDGDSFRLTDTEGDNAPKARGWRSGFLKKRPAAVELVNYRDTTSLRKLVGHRVVTTGLLESRELSVRSITSAGGMCD